MLSEAEFSLLAREVKLRTGVVLAPALTGAVEMRLQPLARREGFASVNELVSAARVRADGQLWSAIVEGLAQCETRFFPDRAVFTRLRHEIIPAALARRGHERVRIWSAACATGQEAYSLALLVEEMREQGLNPAVEIVGTDFSARLIEKARSGLYTQFEVQRGLPIRKLVNYFEKTGDLWRIADRLRAAVRFEQHNLLSRPEFGQFDVILLCNVLGSFDPAAAAVAISHALDAVRPDGCIILGAGEALPPGLEALTTDHGLIRSVNAERCAA